MRGSENVDDDSNDVCSNSDRELCSNSFSGTIMTGVLSAGGEISLALNNVS